MNVKNLRREIAEYILAFFIVLVFVFMLVSLAAVLDDPKKGFKSSEAASWVQAIGSIAAIFGAFMFGERQAKHALETAQVIQDREILRRNEAFLSISSAAAQQMDLVERIFCDRPYDGFRRVCEFKESSLEHIITALKGIPVHELGSAKSVTALLSMIDELQWLLVNIEAYDAELRNEDASNQYGLGREELVRGSIYRIVNSVRNGEKLLNDELLRE